MGVRGSVSRAPGRVARLVVACVLALGLVAPPTVSAAGSSYISGKVFHSNGVTALAGVEVRLWMKTGSWGVSQTKISGANGAYAFGPMVNGTYAVEFRDPSGGHVSEFYNNLVVTDPANATQLALGIGQNMTGISASMDDAAAVTGTVVDSEGLPVPGVTVNAYQHSGGSSFETTVAGTTTTAGDGSYSVRGLAGGSYGMQFWSGTYVPQYYSDSSTSGVTFKEAATPVPVSAGTTVTGIGATMLKWGWLGGLVDSGSGVVDNCIVDAFRAEDGSWTIQPTAMTQTEADGTFICGRLAPGTYRVRFNAPGYPVQFHRSTLAIGYAADVVVPEDATATVSTVLVGGDAVPPVTTASGVPTGWVNVATPVTLTADDGAGGSGVVRIMTSLDSGPAEEYSGPVTVSGTGVHQLAFRALDGFGNAEVTQTATVRVDTAPPETTAAVDPEYLGSATIELVATDPQSGVASTRWTLDSGPVQSGTTVFTAEPGAHTLRFASEDLAGNTEPTCTVTFAVVNDVTPPVTAISGVPTGWAVADVTFSLDAQDDAGGSGVAGAWYRIGDAAQATYTVPATVTAEGTTVVSFASVDLEGNREGTQTATVRIDRTPPLTLHDVQPVSVGAAEITLSPGDGVSGVAWTRWSLDGAPVVEGTSLRVSEPGTHVLELRSCDVAGNEEDTVTVPFTVSSRRYEDGSPGILLTGPWSTLVRTNYSGGSAAYSGAARASMSATFTGTGVEVVGARTTSSGYGRFYVDGVLVATTDLYASPNRFGQVLFSAAGLTEGPHSLCLEVAARKNFKSVGYNVFVDALDVHGTLLVP